MDCCDIPFLKFSEYMEGLATERRPWGAHLEVTQHCNNRCVHCYVDPGRNTLPPDPPLDFLVDVLDALVKEQTLSICITGGDPLVRPDFPALYEAAKRRGFLVTVFTNARLVTEEIADLFKRLPPRLVSVTLYGATEATYDAVADVPGSWQEAMAGIRRLHERRVTGQVKTMVLSMNRHEFADMEQFADDLGWHFKYDPVMISTLEGDCRVMDEGLSPEDMVAFEMADPRRREGFLQAQLRAPDPPETPPLFHCRAGQRSVFIDARGYLLPCFAARHHGWPLDRDRVHESLREIFYEKLLPPLRQPVSGFFPCGRCRLQALCPSCVGLRTTAGLPACGPSPRDCRIATLRAKALGLDIPLPEGACVPGAEPPA